MWHNTWNWAQIFPPSLTVQPGEHAENPETKRRFPQSAGSLRAHGCNWSRSSRVTRPRTRYSPVPYARAYRPHQVHERRERRRCQHATPFGKGSFEIAQLSAGGTMEAFDAVITGRVKNAYALVRPPGHHATADVGMGFCLFGNVASPSCMRAPCTSWAGLRPSTGMCTTATARSPASIPTRDADDLAASGQSVPGKTQAAWRRMAKGLGRV